MMVMFFSKCWKIDVYFTNGAENSERVVSEITAFDFIAVNSPSYKQCPFDRQSMY